MLRRDANVTHQFFVIISLVLMSPLMSLNPTPLIQLVVKVLLLVFLAYHLCLLPNLFLINHSRCTIVGKNLQLRLLPYLVIRLLTLTLFQLLYA